MTFLWIFPDFEPRSLDGFHEYKMSVRLGGCHDLHHMTDVSFVLKRTSITYVLS